MREVELSIMMVRKCVERTRTMRRAGMLTKVRMLSWTSEGSVSRVSLVVVVVGCDVVAVMMGRDDFEGERVRDRFVGLKLMQCRSYIDFGVEVGSVSTLYEPMRPPASFRRSSAGSPFRSN